MGVLLEKALKVKIGRNAVPPTEDEVELAIAYLDGRISGVALGSAINSKHPGRRTQFVASVLRRAVIHGMVLVSRKVK